MRLMEAKDVFGAQFVDFRTPCYATNVRDAKRGSLGAKGCCHSLYGIIPKCATAYN